MKIKRALEEVAAEAQKDGYGFEYMRNIRDGSLEMRIFKGRFGERVTLPVREVVEHETSGTGHKLIFDTYFAPERSIREGRSMDVKQSQKAGNNAIQIQQTVVGDNNYVVGIEIENDSRKPNDNQPKRSLLRRLAAFLNDMVAEIIDALEL